MRWLIFLVVASATLWVRSATAHDPHQATQYTLVTTSDHNHGETAVSPGLNPNVLQALQSIILRDHIWADSHISICFGPEKAVTDRKQLVERIIAIASEWQDGTRITMDFGTPSPRICKNSESAKIRIDIDDPGGSSGIFQSLIGNEAASESIKGYEPYSVTLMFPSNSFYYSSDDVIRFYVLHEIGHALGAEHEHQRIDCQYNYDYIAAHFGFPNGSTAKSSMEKVFKSHVSAYPNGRAVLTRTAVETKYDNFSVMKYNLSTMSSPSGDDPNVYVDGSHSPCYRSGWVSSLTLYDKVGMQLAYAAPRAATAALIASLSEGASFASLPQGIQSRLTDPRLGRGDLADLARMGMLKQPTKGSNVLDAIVGEIGTVSKSPKALASLKKILLMRSDQ